MRANSLSWAGTRHIRDFLEAIFRDDVLKDIVDQGCRSDCDVFWNDLVKCSIYDDVGWRYFSWKCSPVEGSRRLIRDL